MRQVLRVLVAVALVALSARLDIPVPGSQVPQSAQTLTVVLVGLVLGAGAGAAALAAYLLAGGMGLPVFADGASGWGHLVGPTAGYLAGFVVAAAVVGALAERGLIRRPLNAFGAMAGAHALILGLGWLRLAVATDATAAYGQGVAPFLAGGLLKSVLAAGVAVWWLGRQRRSSTDTSSAPHGQNRPTVR